MDNMESDSGQVRPSHARQIKDLELSVRKLWARLNALSGGLYGTEFVFDFPGVLYEAESDRFPLNKGVTIDEIQFTVRVPSAADNIRVDLYKNSDLIETFYIGAGVTSLIRSVSYAYGLNDTMWFSLMAPGTNSEGLLCVVRVKD